jgi:hypothetical protein
MLFLFYPLVTQGCKIHCEKKILQGGNLKKITGGNAKLAYFIGEVNYHFWFKKIPFLVGKTYML